MIHIRTQNCRTTQGEESADPNFGTIGSPDGIFFENEGTWSADNEGIWGAPANGDAIDEAAEFAESARENQIGAASDPELGEPVRST